MSALKRNSLLQRVLKKSEEVNAEKGREKVGDKKNEAAGGRSGLSKRNWIRKLGNYSPSRQQVPSNPTRTNTMKAVDRSGLCNTYEAATSRRTSGSPRTPPEMPDLESIIHEFEMGYLSPTKQDEAADGSKQKNFVKKIVAAFEVKYKAYNDSKTTACETEESHETSKLNTAVTGMPKRRSGIFGSPFKSSSEESKSAESTSPSKQNQETPSPLKSNAELPKRRSGIFSSPLKKIFNEDEDLDRFSKPMEDEKKSENRRSGIFYALSKNDSDDSKSSRRSGIFSSVFIQQEIKDTSESSLEIYSSPVTLDRENSKDSSSDCYSVFKFDKEEETGRRTDLNFSPSRISSLDETKTLEDLELDTTLPEPEETILLDGNTLPKTSTRIDQFLKIEGNLGAKEGSSFDKTPKIVGAFLKKPIEVEDTSIDWIPITGKKLPRKRSLKKLLYSLTGKKLEKRSKLFSSERNLSEEQRELQDSGYDEISCSSSSLTSLISISEALLMQENTYVEPEKRIVLRTFKSKNSLDEEEDEAFHDAYRYSRKPNDKQLRLIEVPREQLKLDLGPAYPSPNVTTKSLDREGVVPREARSPSPIYDDLNKLPKHPYLSKIPKHPFVSVTKMDEAQEEFHDPAAHRVDQRQCRNSRVPSLVVKNDLYEVEFRRSCDDICTSSSCRSSSSATSDYDVPRRFLSKSENAISSMCRSTVTKTNEEPIYDVPKPRIIERPKSSLYEEALASKRRNAYTEKQVGSNVYAVPRILSAPYATVRPRSCKIYLRNEALYSCVDLASVEKSSAF